MKKTLIAVIVASLLLGACQDQKDEGQKEKVYTVGTEYNWPPLEFIDENKQKVGFDVDMIQAIAKAVGTVELQEVSFDPIFTSSLTVASTSGSRRPLPKSVGHADFTEPYLNAGQMLVVPVASRPLDDGPRTKRSAFRPEPRANSLDGRGYVGGYDDIANAFADLANGRVDAVLPIRRSLSTTSPGR